MPSVFLVLLFYLLRFNQFPVVTWEEKCSIYIHRLKYTVWAENPCVRTHTHTILPCNPHIWMENKQDKSKQHPLPTSSPPSHKHEPLGSTCVHVHSAGKCTPRDMLLRPHTIINPSTSVLFIYFGFFFLCANVANPIRTTQSFQHKTDDSSGTTITCFPFSPPSFLQ